MKYIAFLLLIVASNLGFAQVSSSSIWNVQAMSSENREKVPSATLSVNKLEYFSADSTGLFSIPIAKIHNGDTVFVSCLGYRTSKVLVSENHKLPSEIELTPIAFQLNDITISNGKTKLEKKVVGTDAFSVTKRLSRYEESIGLYINNNNKYKGFIKSVTLKMHNANKGIDKPFKLKLFSKETGSQFPVSELMDEIIIRNTLKQSSFTVDLENLGIKIPEAGFFVVVETLKASYYSSQVMKVNSFYVNELPSIKLTTFPKSRNKDNYGIFKLGSSKWVIFNQEPQIQAELSIENL